MWVRFTDVFKWSPPHANKAWSQTFQPSVQNVTQACADAALAEGKAVRVTRPRKGEVQK